MAPDLSDATPDNKNPEESGRESPDRSDPTVEELWRSQAGLLQLVSMLGDEFDEEEGDDDHELGVFAADLQDHHSGEEWEDLDENEGTA